MGGWESVISVGDSVESPSGEVLLEWRLNGDY